MSQDLSQQYMLMIRGDYAAWDRISADEKQTIMERYYAFANRLRDEGRSVAGSGLTSKSRLVTAEGGAVRVIDGPYAESKEALTGYFVIRARDLEDAVRVARDCPCLTHGETVEVVELGHA